MSTLACLFGDEPELNEHQIAWYSQDFNAVAKLAQQFKEPKEQSLFAIVENVTSKKGGYKNIDTFSDYDQFMINQCLSQHVVMIGYVSELNRMGTISNQMHYDYLFHSVRKTSLPKTAFAKVTDDWEYKILLELYSRYYQISKTKAMEWIDFDTKTDKIVKVKKLLKQLALDSSSDVMKVISTKAARTDVINTITNDW